MTMRVMLMAKDKEGALDVRKANREAHLAYLKETGVVEQGGPLLDEAGEWAGSLLILDVEDLAAAKAWAENDPYAKAGLFAEVHISAWNRVLG
jgi:uncharacterized protein YciI